MAVQRIPISLSKNDYAYLNYIRQGYLYGNHSVSDLPEIGNLLKAIALFGLNVITNWENGGKHMLEYFFSQANDEEALKGLPSTTNDFINRIGKTTLKLQLRGILESIEHNENMEKKEDIGFNEQMNRDINHISHTTTEHGLSNYILTLKNDEMLLLDMLKLVFQSFSNKSFSYSELIRFLFRYFFIEPRTKNVIEKVEQHELLSVFFIFGLYGFTPTEAILLRMESAYMVGLNIPKEKIDILKKIYTDQTLFDIYIETVKKIIEEKSGKKEKGLASKFKAPKLELEPLFDDLNQNITLQEKYKSIVSGFSFHSSFLGYSLLDNEWYYCVHDIPLLATYFYSKVKNVSIGNIHMQLGLKNFQDYFQFLFKLSKKANENDDFLYSHQKNINH